MGDRKLTAASNFGAGEKLKQASTTSKGTIAHRRTDISIAQSVLLIWLDHNNTATQHNADCRKTITRLRRFVDSVTAFTDCDQCIDFLTDVDTSKVFMIISGELIQHIVQLIHDITQIDCIYIVCGNEKCHDQWTKEWSKIKGVFAEISPIYKILNEVAQQCEHDAIGVNFMSTTSEPSNTNLNQLDCSFMYTQIMKEILLTIEFTQQHINEFTKYCREVFADNIYKLNNVNKFDRKYQDETPIWWYSCDSFLYPMLNRALRTMDVNIIIKMGFFIRDLHEHIEQLHSEQFSGHQSSQVLTVYRGQSLCKTDFNQLMQTKGGLMSFNNFLSTSKDRDMSMTFAHKGLFNPDIVGILFVITIDPSIHSTPFASINDVSCLEEDEVLFSMHTVFRIRDMKQMGENNHLWEVDLALTSGNDQELQALTERMRKESQPNSKPWHRLGLLLLKMGQSEKAQQVYEAMLGQVADEQEKATIYSLLGWVKDDHGEYAEALIFYEKSHEIYQKILPSNHPNLTKSYNNIGNVYRSMGENSKALSYYEKDLEISQKSLPSNHPDLATSYSNIGLVYDSMGEYSKALSSNEKALEIRQKYLPPNHPDLAASYHNIGMLYDNVGEYSKALSFYGKALEIRQKTLPSNHPELATSYNNIGMGYKNMGDYSKALSYYEKSLEIWQKSLPSNHPNLGASYSNIGNVYYNMGEHLKALSSHEKALEIRQKSLPSNHLDLAASYNNISGVYYATREYSKAVSFHEKTLEIEQQALPANHPDLAASFTNMGLLYENIGNHSKAFSYFKRAVDIGEHSLPSNHPHLQLYRKNLDLVKKKL